MSEGIPKTAIVFAERARKRERGGERESLPALLFNLTHIFAGYQRNRSSLAQFKFTARELCCFGLSLGLGLSWAWAWAWVGHGT